MNQVCLIGRATKDPEIRYTQVGDAVANFSIAVDEGYGDKKKACFFEITCWRKTAENVTKYVKKGNKVGITGSLKQDTWEKDGVKKSRISITAFQVEFLESKPKDDIQETQETQETKEDISWNEEK